MIPTTMLSATAAWVFTCVAMPTSASVTPSSSSLVHPSFASLSARYALSLSFLFMPPLPLSDVGSMMFLCLPVRVAVRASVPDVVSTIYVVQIDGFLTKFLSVHLGIKIK